MTVYDLTALKRVDDEVADDMTIGELITHLQEGRTHTCPKCGGDGEIHSPAERGEEIYSPCDVCQGVGKTEAVWESYSTGTAYRIVTS